MQIRDRIKEFRRVKASQLRPHPKNWRTHPPAQQDALRGVLAEIGYAGALLARELPDGSLELIDGHLRAETTPEAEVPVLIWTSTSARRPSCWRCTIRWPAWPRPTRKCWPTCWRRSRPRTTPCRRCSTRCWPSPRRRRTSRNRTRGKDVAIPEAFQVVDRVPRRGRAADRLRAA